MGAPGKDGWSDVSMHRGLGSASSSEHSVCWGQLSGCAFATVSKKADDCTETQVPHQPWDWGWQREPKAFLKMLVSE